MDTTNKIIITTDHYVINNIYRVTFDAPLADSFLLQ